MPRTTMDIDAPILDDLRRLQRQEGKSLGKLISELLAQALAQRKSGRARRPAFHWKTSPGALRIDLTDKDALWDALDAAARRKLGG